MGELLPLSHPAAQGEGPDVDDLQVPHININAWLAEWCMPPRRRQKKKRLPPLSSSQVSITAPTDTAIGAEGAQQDHDALALDSPGGALLTSTSAPTLPSLQHTSASTWAAFLERQEDNPAFKVRREFTKIKRELCQETRSIDEVEFWGARGLTGFRTYLRSKFGSILAGWRVLDQDGNGRLSHNEFCQACNRMGYHGNLKKLWQELDVDGNGSISMMEVDADAGLTLATFKSKLLAKYGDMLTAWRQGIDTNGNGRIEEQEVIDCCKRLGWSINPHRLYKMLIIGPKGKGATLQDFDPLAAHMFYKGDFEGILVKQRAEFSEELSDSKDPAADSAGGGGPSANSTKMESGAALRWRAALLQADRDDALRELKKTRQHRLGLHTVKGFKEALVGRCGSLRSAWRAALDLDGNDRITHGEFCQALDRLGFHGNVKGLWNELAKGKEVITFGDLDPETDRALSQLISKMTDKYGNMLLAWMAIDKNGDGLLSEEEFVALCAQLDYKGSAKALFRVIQPSRDRRLLTLQDLDTKAYQALSRGDFRMLSERDSPESRGKSLLEKSFHERQEAGFFYQIRRAWDAAQREEFAKACRSANAPEHLVDTVEEFEHICKHNFGSMMEAWRQCLDSDRNGKLTFKEFCTACRRLGYAGDLKLLFRHYDKERKGVITLESMDAEAHKMIMKFLEMLEERYGSLQAAWADGFGKDPYDNVDHKELKDACANLGFPYNADKLFRFLRPAKGAVSLTLEDLDPLCARKKLLKAETYRSLPKDAVATQRSPAGDLVMQQSVSSTEGLRAESSLGTLQNAGASTTGGQVPTQGGAKALRRAMIGAHNTLLAAWRVAFDPRGTGGVQYPQFCRAVQECCFNGQVKALWKELAASGSDSAPRDTVRFVDIAPRVQRMLDHVRGQLLSRYPTLCEAWREGFKQHDDGGSGIRLQDFSAVWERLGLKGHEPKDVFQALQLDASLYTLQRNDLKALLIGVPPGQEQDSLWGEGPGRGALSPSPREERRSTCGVSGRESRSKVKSHKAQGSVAGFKRLLIAHYGSIFAGWRQGLDIGNKGAVTMVEFANCCRELGAQAVKSVWRELDKSGLGKIKLSDLDEEVSTGFEQLQSLLLDTHGSAQEGWSRCFENPAPAGMHIEKAKFVKQCKELGFAGNAERLFRLMQPSPSRQYLIYADLWADQNPRSPEPPSR